MNSAVLSASLISVRRSFPFSTDAPLPYFGGPLYATPTRGGCDDFEEHAGPSGQGTRKSGTRTDGERAAVWAICVIEVVCIVQIVLKINLRRCPPKNVKSALFVL